MLGCDQEMMNQVDKILAPEAPHSEEVGEGEEHHQPQPETEIADVVDYSRYDLNQDGMFDTADVKAIFPKVSWFDLNQDGMIDSEDYWHVFRKYWSHPFPKYREEVASDKEFYYTHEELDFYYHFGHVVHIYEIADAEPFWQRVALWAKTHCDALRKAQAERGVKALGIDAPIPTLLLFDTKEEREAYFAEAFPVVLDETNTYYTLFLAQKGIPCAFRPDGEIMPYLPVLPVG